MTAVKHPFECPEPNRFKRFKLDSLVDQCSFKVTKVCHAAVKPVSHPKTPLPAQPREYAIPAHSMWFDFKKIHQIEREEFPELKDPKIERTYRRIRNRAVKLFRLYPTVVVTVSTLRHSCGGDLKFLQKIHQFLAKWGLINFISTFGNQVNALDAGDARLVNDFSFITDGPLLNVASGAQKQLFEIPCTVCKAPCGEGHFMSRKYPGIVICPLCFSHHNTLDQLETPHESFEFRVLPPMRIIHSQQPQQRAEHQRDDLMFDAYRQNKNWVAIGEACERSPLDSMISIARNTFADNVETKHIMEHDFNDRSVTYELLERLVQVESPEPASDVTYRGDWEDLLGEIAAMESAAKQNCK